jgi:uncharacterized membrane protein
MDFGNWWGYGCGMFCIFPILCMIFMVAIMVLVFRRCGCMPMWRNRPDLPDDGRDKCGCSPFSERK